MTHHHPKASSSQSAGRRFYELGDSTLSLQFGDLLDSHAEALVSSDDFMLSCGGGVSAAIAAAGGHAIALDAAKCIPLRLGDVVATTAGALPARYIFHVVTIGSPRDGEEHLLDGVDGQMRLIESATRKAIALARALGISSIAFPALGTGAAGLSRSSVAAGMAEAMYHELRDSPTPLHLEIYLASKPWQSDLDYLVFFEEFTALLRAPIRPAIIDPPPPRELSPTAQRLIDNERHINELEREMAAGTISEQQAADEISEREQQAWDIAGSDYLRLFVSYSHEDSDDARQFLKHLRGLAYGGHIVWSDHVIPPGAKWEHEIRDALETADIAIFLITASFLASDYCVGKEWRRAKELSEAGRLRMVPVLVAPCFFKPLVGDIQVLPPGAQPVKQYASEDAAYLEIMNALNALVTEQLAERSA